MNYYNDNAPKACAWLRELIAAGELPAGDVDCRSILEVRADELRDYDQCHFFAGIGGWPLSLRQVGLEHATGVWTGSCPCQPFSSAGRGRGVKDERHLWPAFFSLIKSGRPTVVFGEQVASAAVIGRTTRKAQQDSGKPPVWLDGVCSDLEAAQYAVGAAVIPAGAVGAPHRRPRLFWVADGRLGDAKSSNWEVSVREWRQVKAGAESGGTGGFGATGGLEYSGHRTGCTVLGDKRNKDNTRLGQSSTERTGGVFPTPCDDERRERQSGPILRRPGASGGPSAWSSFDILPCRDGKSRRVESGTFPLVARLSGGVVPSGNPSREEAQASGEYRVMRLRGYGNAIVPEVAVQFIEAWSLSSALT